MPSPRFRILTLMTAVAVIAVTMAVLRQPASPGDYVFACEVMRVDGAVARVDPFGGRLELTVGADDGLVPGRVLHVFRIDPQPRRLGQARVVSVTPDTAVAVVSSMDASFAAQIQPGDCVSTDEEGCSPTTANP